MEKWRGKEWMKIVRTVKRGVGVWANCLRAFLSKLLFLLVFFVIKKQGGRAFYSIPIKKPFFASVVRFFFFLWCFTLLEKSLYKAVFYAKAAIKQKLLKFVFFYFFSCVFSIWCYYRNINWKFMKDRPPKPERAGGFFIQKKVLSSFYNYTIKYTKVDRKICLSSFIGIVNSWQKWQFVKSSVGGRGRGIPPHPTAPTTYPPKSTRIKDKICQQIYTKWRKDTHNWKLN